MIYLLLVLLIVLLIITFYSNKKELISPSFVFCFSFVFSLIWAVAFYEEWNLSSFHKNTFYVILGGVILFVITSSIIKLLFSVFSKKKKRDFCINYIYIDKYVKIFVIIILLLTIFFSIKDLLRITGYSINNIFAAIKRYDYLDKFSSVSVSFSRITHLLRTISNALTYWFMFVFVNNFIYNKKISILDLSIILLGITSTLLSGGRNTMITIILAGASMFMLLYYKKNTNKKSKLSFRTKLLIIILPIIGLLSFPKLTYLVGRNVSTTNTYYLAIYCGAPIKNLDTYLQEYEDSVYENKENITFRNFIVWYNSKFGTGETYKFDQPFRYINGYQLGNVYTLFYSYVYDYGYIGVITLTSLMAVITQFIYEKCKRVNNINKPNLWILIYGFLFCHILLAYFNNKFYEVLVTISFVKYVFFWIIFNNTLLKIKFKK